jgi:hypothetical protein
MCTHDAEKRAISVLEIYEDGNNGCYFERDSSQHGSEKISRQNGNLVAGRG